jgi:ketosteroid isomerase-like protein
VLRGRLDGPLSDAALLALADATYGAINRGDLDGLLELTAEDVEFTSLVAEAEGTTYRGHDGVRTWWDTVRGEFDEVRWEVLEFRPHGERGITHFRLVGTLGGVPVEQEMWQAIRTRAGKIVWWSTARTEREALEATGIA